MMMMFFMMIHTNVKPFFSKFFESFQTVNHMSFDDATDEIKIAFAALDKDGDSELSKEEIAVLIENLSGQSPSADQIARVFAWFAVPISGKIPLNRLIEKINEWISGSSSHSRQRAQGSGRVPDSPRRVRKRGAVQRSIKKFFVDLLRNTTSCMERLKKHPEEVLRRLEMLGNDVATTLGCINNYHSLMDEDFTAEQKLKYATSCVSLFESSNGMKNILKPLMNANDPASIVKSLEQLKYLMELKRVFRSPEERYEINDVIFQIFNGVYQSRVVRFSLSTLKRERLSLYVKARTSLSLSLSFFLSFTHTHTQHTCSSHSTHTNTHRWTRSRHFFEQSGWDSFKIFHLKMFRSN